MTNLRVAVAGVGNNISALLQGIAYYRGLLASGIAVDDLPGVRRPWVGQFGVGDVDLVAAFDVQPEKLGKDLTDAVHTAPNNYPLLASVAKTGVTVAKGISCPKPNGHPVPDSREDIVSVRDILVKSNAEVLLYSLPTGLQREAEAYAQAALEAGVAFVNCTPELVARNPAIYEAYCAKGVPLIGDDLASHLGSSIVHRHLLGLLEERGITLSSSYQLNLGGNEDFRNLLHNGSSKAQSKKNALSGSGVDLNLVSVVPSAAYVPGLCDNKVGLINIEGKGWAGTPVTIDLKLKVQDSSNAAGVIIDLLRFAGVAKRAGVGGMVIAARDLLKSPGGLTETSEASSMHSKPNGLVSTPHASQVEPC